MHNDRLIKITTGGSRKALRWIAQELLWSELIDKLKNPARSTESFSDYMQLKKSQQDDLKDVGGYVAGTLSSERRKANNVVSRDVITLDLDNIGAGQTHSVLQCVDSLQCGYCVYSTRKHCEAAPRLRVLIPLNRSCTVDEYEPIARKLATFVGMELADPSTFEASRLMYWPSCSADSQYVFAYSDKPFIDADGMLKLYTDWHNVSEWPGVQVPKMPRGTKQADPTSKEGIVGAFCKIYNVYQAIDAFIPEAYTPCDNMPGRYSFTGGSTTGGAVIYEDGVFIFSHHATDPAGGKLCNAFDLVRLHLFGDKDDEAKPDTPTNKLPSFVKMCELAVGDSEVAGILNRERYEKATSAFSTEISVDPSSGELSTDWINQLKLSTMTGAPLPTIDNIVIIFENDPLIANKIVFDEFSSRTLALGSLPWDKRETRRQWVDNDDAGLRRYIEAVYHIAGKERIYDALSLISNNHRINDVQDYLRAVPNWDGKKRLDSLFIDYLGAEDNIYVRDVTRKSIVAAVARAMTPGIKYDNMPILAGPQGIGKSTLLKILGGSWFSDSLTSFEGKDACELIQGTWINEIGELNGLSRSETNAVKQFLSKTEDIYRAAYGRNTGHYPRRCVFFGTTNDSEFLRDKTGNRRFWPIDCGKHEPAKSVFKDLVNEIQQIWAEAIMLWSLGEPLYLTGEAERLSLLAQEDHAESNVKEGIVKEFLSRDIPLDWDKRTLAQRRMYWSGDFAKMPGTEVRERDKVCAVEILCEAFGMETKYIRKSDSAEINAILGHLEGWERAKSGLRFNADYGHQRGFKRSEKK